MTIYLVRWPSLTASLVGAESDEDLLDILDQAANPDWCEWSVYDGPFAIDFRLPVEWSIRNEHPGQPISPDQIVVGDLGSLAQRYVIAAMEMDLGVDEEGVLMAERVLEKAFPSVHAAVEQLFADEGTEQASEGVLPEPRLRQALHAELARTSSASWRRAHLYRKTDPISTVAKQLDMPVALVQRLAEEVHPVGDEVAAERTPANRPGGDSQGERRGMGCTEHRSTAMDRRLLRICSEVLFYVWDPIGVRLSAAARDEYDSYAEKVADYLAEGHNARKIADYLTKVRTTSIALAPAPEQDMIVAELLIDWRESLREGIA